MRLAVILPVYNAEKYLMECLDSLFVQTFDDFCVLAINDASSDNSGAILENYAKKEPRLRVYHFDNNQGDPVATQFAMQIVNCMQVDYVARMDADDICFPNRFEKQVSFLDTNPQIGILGSNMLCFDDNGNVHNADIDFIDADIKTNIAACRPSICNPTSVYRLSYIKPLNIRYDEHVTACDYGMWVNCALNGIKFANLPDVLLKYRIHGGQASKKFNLINESVQVFLEKLFRVLLPSLTNDEVRAFAAINHGLGSVTLKLDDVLLAFEAYEKIKDLDKSVLGEDRQKLLSHFSKRVDYVKTFM